MTIKPIRTNSDYQAALARVDELWDAEQGTPEGDELDVIVTLLEVFESRMNPVDAPDPIEAIKFRMEQQGLKDADLVPYLGQRSRVSEILNRRRKLTLHMIRSLNEGLHIPLDCLISEYELKLDNSQG